MSADFEHQTLSCIVPSCISACSCKSLFNRNMLLDEICSLAYYYYFMNELENYHRNMVTLSLNRICQVLLNKMPNDISLFPNKSNWFKLVFNLNLVIDIFGHTFLSIFKLLCLHEEVVDVLILFHVLVDCQSEKLIKCFNIRIEMPSFSNWRSTISLSSSFLKQSV